jgi:hypothetical protein
MHSFIVNSPMWVNWPEAQTMQSRDRVLAPRCLPSQKISKQIDSYVAFPKRLHRRAI